MIQGRTRALVGVLVLVLVIVGLVGLAQAVPPVGKPSKPRFVVLPPDQLGQVWVKDGTTSLQWQKTPSTGLVDWETASTHCTDLQGGSRLPEVVELIGLVDYSMALPGPVLPAGHPFVDIQVSGNGYWTTSPDANSPNAVWNVYFHLGNLIQNGKVSVGGLAWCVR